MRRAAPRLASPRARARAANAEKPAHVECSCYCPITLSSFPYVSENALSVT
ncbi:hypothetical protein X777_16880 [Ooceraea biroi]|uniref:Uncharacterized protein n=1 Tax=Ooceraea biroi TaxID=2015173 RepID=A0A026WTC7_OOCBI|nr:hypothetical protein X777_16880 [Ooceraea biroi]